MSVDNYFRSKIKFSRETNDYLKDAISFLDFNKNINVSQTFDGEILPHYFNGSLVKDSDELKGCLLAYESYVNMPFELSIKSIKKIHSIAFKYHNGSTRKGRFKDCGNVMEFPLKTGGSLRIKTSLPDGVDNHISRLVNWTNAQLAKKEIHPLIVIALFKYEYVSIHPFDNGNGRTSRILTALLLKQAGYLFAPYWKLEKAINDNRQPYYTSLSIPQMKRGTELELIDHWTVYLVSGLQHIIRKLDRSN